MKTTSLMKILGWFCISGLSVAAVPDRDWPSVVPTPIVDAPMRDTAICQGPGGIFYLTGTLGSRRTEDGGQPSESTKLPPSQGYGEASATKTSMDSTPRNKSGDQAPDTRHPETSPGIKLPTPDTLYDFENTREVRLWRSTDLCEWEDLGAVFDIHEPVHEDGGAWMRMFRWKPDRPEGDQFVRGITEPELHHINGEWYLCFAISGEGCGIAKSTSGKPEGPYRHHARITAAGRSPSLFEDSDGTVYWLFDGGRIAPLTDDLKALAKLPRWIRPEPNPSRGKAQREALRENPDAAPFSDVPEKVGTHGAFLFKRDGRYFLTAAETNPRLFNECDDTWIAYADHLEGPWSARHLMIHHGGGVTVFEGPDNSLVTQHRGRYDAERKKHVDGPQLYAALAGRDEMAMVRDRASFIPLEWVGPERWDVEFFAHAESFPRKPQAVFTQKGPWAHMKPPEGIGEARDIAVSLQPDGYYYLGGAFFEHKGELPFFRSKDLMTWEKVGPFWTVEQAAEDGLTVFPHKPGSGIFRGDSAKKPRGELPRPTLFSARMFHLFGNYYVTFALPGVGTLGLRSTTESALGPYEMIGKVGGRYAHETDHSGKTAFFHGPNDAIFRNGWIDWILQVGEVTEEILQTPGWPMNYKPVDIGGCGNWMCRDDFGHVYAIEGLYVYSAFSSGFPQSGVSVGMGYTGEGGDGLYAVGPTPWGPFRNFKTLEHAEYFELFKDKEGQWWNTVFFSRNSGPYWLRLGLMPLNITREGDDLTIEVQDDNYTERQLKIMGGGEIAEVQTVREILE